MEKKSAKNTRSSASPWRRRFKQLVVTVSTPRFAKLYVVFSLVVLLATTVFWSVLSAKLQGSNADQLVNSYLFEHTNTFHNALFPGQHSLLLKWPIFLLIRILGISSATFVVFTVGLSVATVAALALIIYRVERRPLIFGTLCLALASVLVLVPAQPYAGGILPVNMAMLSTRNLEYILYICSLALLLSSPRVKSAKFWLAIAGLSLLIASDKLFFVLSLGGALLALVVYAFASGWNLVSLTVHWVVGGLIATAAALGILGILNSTGITHISNQSVAGPFGVVENLHTLVKGTEYAVSGLLTNLGANPAFNDIPSTKIGHQAYVNLTGIGGLAFIINAAIAIGGFLIICSLIRTSLAHNKNDKINLDMPSRLSIGLIWTTLAAVGVFIISNHYYVVDARYLTIALFTVFISAATFLRQKKLNSVIYVVAAGAICTIGVLLGSLSAAHTYNGSKAALADVNERNSIVAQALRHHPVSVLVGDYWRVIPTKLASGGKINVEPLSGCTQPKNSLTSLAWQPNLTNHSFAYLLTLDGNLTDYPNCTLAQTINSYGRPNTSILIAGSLSNPKELLLFYDHGIHKSAPASNSNPLGTVLPITLDQLPHTYCSVPTDMNIVAHEDDDLLFMNPDLMHDIKAGHCVRTVYITAGDAGGDKFYWLSREQGSEAAYATMLGINDIWVDRIVKLTDQEYITVSNPKGNNSVSLIFMHLPDGNLKGQGFSASGFESVAKLESGAIGHIQSVDGQSVYSSNQLVDALTSLMHAYQPAQIRTQANFISQRFPDHSDHMTVGRYTIHAYQTYETQQYEGRITVPLEFYIGYPVHDRPTNITGNDLAQKEATFAAYSRFDSDVCQSLQRCLNDPAYGIYLTREYQNNY